MACYPSVVVADLIPAGKKRYDAEEAAGFAALYGCSNALERIRDGVALRQQAEVEAQ